MRFNDLIKNSVSSLTTHKSRSALTVLGIVIGITAIIVVVSVGSSAEGLIRGEIQSFGPENVFINPGNPSDGLFSFSGQSNAVLLKSLTTDDVHRLKNKSNVPDAALVNPSVNGSFSIAYESETMTVNTIGTGAAAFDIYNLSAANGRLFTEEEVDSKAAVVVLGKNVVKELFGSEDANPLGERVKIKGKSFKVIGVFSFIGSNMWGIDDMAMIPYTTAQEYLLGIRHFHEIAVQARDVSAVPDMVKDIKIILRDNHDVKEGEGDDFIVSTQEDMIETIDGILKAITVFLAFVAAISLLVGGVGVMNIMFVSVTERTREIGLRKSLGATNKNILSQFLLEAVLLTGGGGIAGAFMGTLITYAITIVASLALGTNFPFVFSLFGVFLGLLVSSAVGIFFGIFPAYRASKKSPMEALRYE